MKDSDALRERLDRGGAAVVVGAGWIGAEVAASLRVRGLEVTVLDPNKVPLERVLGAEVGRSTATSTPTTAFGCSWGPAWRRSRRRGRRARPYRDGRLLECDFVVVERGSCRAPSSPRRPASRWTTASSSTSTCAPVPGVFAAGDVANAHHPFYGERIRVEHWANALNQGPAAAQHARPR